MIKQLYLCATCEDAFRTIFKDLHEVEEAPARHTCAMCKSSGYFGKYEYRLKSRRKEQGDEAAGT